MTNETRERINAYKRALPGMRERVVAVALLLAMSVSMVASASFAWLTISRSPEVTSVSTNVAANGNLEIALATGNANAAEPPEESAVGDSSAARDQSIVESNITWGNLVNLSDPSYGLSDMLLRPSVLNEGEDFLAKPLYGAQYTSDGRVQKLNNSFQYTAWMYDEFDVGYFGLSSNLGVRAISSVALSATDGSAIRYLELQSEAVAQNTAAVNTFNRIMMKTDEHDWMPVLARVMGYHMCAVLDSDFKNTEVEYADVKQLYDMFSEFIVAYEQEVEAYAKLVNYQLFILNGGDETKYTPYNK